MVLIKRIKFKHLQKKANEALRRGDVEEFNRLIDKVRKLVKE